MAKNEMKKDFRLSFEQHWRLTDAAARRGITPSALLRQLVEAGLANQWATPTFEGDKRAEISVWAVVPEGGVA